MSSVLSMSIVEKTTLNLKVSKDTEGLNFKSYPKCSHESREGSLGHGEQLLFSCV